MTFVMFLFRYVLFDLQESSKYLIAKGRDEEAIKVILDLPYYYSGLQRRYSLQVLEYLAKRNGKTITLTVEKLKAVPGGDRGAPPPSTMNIVKRSFSSFSLWVERLKLLL